MHPSVPPRDGPGGTPLGGAIPLQWKLPLLVSAFLAGEIALMVAFTYTTLLQRTELIFRDRLGNAARVVAAGAAAAMAERADSLRAAAADPAVRAALEGPAPDGSALPAARARLARLAASDTLLPVELWDAAGRPVLVAGRPLPARERRVPPLPGAEVGSVRFGPMHASGARVRFWILAPVGQGGRRVGWIAQARNVGGPPGATRALRDLLREEVSLHTRNAGGSFWVMAPGKPAAAPLRRDSTATGIWYEHAGRGRTLAAEAPVAGTPWVMVLESPESWVFKRPRTTLRSLAAAGLVVAAVGAALAWLVGRRVTGPLATLAAAAEALARGRYEHPLVGGRDEIGRLAASFDAMARQVEGARRELERRVDEAQRARADAERARAEAEEANRAKGDFLAVMSHELRTPLNAIGGYTELLEMGLHGPVNEAQREALSRIARSQAHLLSLINDLLSFSRIEAGQMRYAIDDVPLHEALAGLEELVAPQVAASSLEFRCLPCEPGVAARADRDKLRQVMLNLLGNAVKYTPRGGSVTVACEADERRVRVHVRDTGTGIRPERLPHIFEPFVQGDRALNRPGEGVGLGLAISRDLARGMGGDVTVASEPGRGSVFTVELPRAGVVAAGAIPMADVPAAAEAPTG